MATVPKVLFMEQKHTPIFLLKFRHQSLTRDLYLTNLQHQADVTANRERERGPQEASQQHCCLFFLLSEKPNHPIKGRKSLKAQNLLGVSNVFCIDSKLLGWQKGGAC